MAKNLPSVTSPLPRDLQTFIQRVREAIDGGGLDGLVTARQMVAAGIASFSNGSVLSTGPLTIDTPRPPTNLAGSGALASVILTWDGPTYSGHAYTEIWAATQTVAQVAASEAPVISQAELVGMTAGNNFSHTIGNSGTRYYWVKNVNKNGLASAFNATNGLAVSTGDNPAYLLELLTDEITSSQLHTALGTRIDLIDAASSVTGSVAYQVAQEALARATADGTNSVAITGLDTRLTTAEGSVTTQAGSFTALNSALTTANGNITGNTTAITGLSTTVTTQGDDITAQSSDITALEATVNNGTTGVGATATALGGLTATVTTQGGEITAVSDDVTLLTTTVGGHTTSIAAHTSSIDGVEGKFTVKIDNNNHVSGFGLISTANDATPTAAFGVRADQFWVAPPAVAPTANAPTSNLYVGRAWTNTAVSPVTKYYDGSAWQTTPPNMPFVVRTTPGPVNGVTVPAGVYIDTAMIADATITQAKIGTLNADVINSGLLNTVDFYGNTIAGSSIYLGGTVNYTQDAGGNNIGIASVASPKVVMTSTGAVFAVDAFTVDNPGGTDATPFSVVNDVVGIDTALIRDGTITMAKIDDTIQSTNYVASGGSATPVGWKLAKDGTIDLTSGTVTAGTLKSTDGNFVIDLTNGTLTISV